MANIQIDEFHIKVRWLFALAKRSEAIALPEDFPKFGTWKAFAQALGTTSQHLGNWCPPPHNPLRPLKSGHQADKPPVGIARNMARLFGFAPMPAGVDDDPVWQEWWARQWPSFTPSETNKLKKAPTEDFKKRYREALQRHELQFQKPILPAPKAATALGSTPSPIPSVVAHRAASQIIASAAQFRAELDAEMRFDNVKAVILRIIGCIADLPADSRNGAMCTWTSYETFKKLSAAVSMLLTKLKREVP